MQFFNVGFSGFRINCYYTVIIVSLQEYIFLISCCCIIGELHLIKLAHQLSFCLVSYLLAVKANGYHWLP